MFASAYTRPHPALPPGAQQPCGTWWPSEGSHHVCFLRGLWVGRLQLGPRGSAHPGTCSVLSGSCAGRGGWAVAGASPVGGREGGKLGLLAASLGSVLTTSVAPAWPQGSEQEACPSAAALQAGHLRGFCYPSDVARGQP